MSEFAFNSFVANDVAISDGMARLYAVKLAGVAFIGLVLADDGFVVDRQGIGVLFSTRVLQGASVLCPMRAGNDNKLYFQRHGT